MYVNTKYKIKQITLLSCLREDVYLHLELCSLCVCRLKRTVKKGKSTYSSNHLQSSRGNGRPPWPKRGEKWVQCTSGLKKKNENVDTMSRNWQHRLTTNRVAFTKKRLHFYSNNWWLYDWKSCDRCNLQGVFSSIYRLTVDLLWKAQSTFGCSLQHSCWPRDSGGPSSVCSVCKHCKRRNSTENQDQNVLSIYKETKRQHEIWDKLKKMKVFNANTKV